MSEPRTALQNKALHPTLRAYAKKLNDAGYDYIDAVQAAKLKGFAVSWTEQNIKGFFDAVTKAMYDKTSSELTTVEMQEAYEVFAKHMSLLSGVSQAWLSKEEQMMIGDKNAD